MKHVKLFEQFVKDSFINEKFTFTDAIETAGENPNAENISSALKALKARSGSDISIFAETPNGDDDLYDAIERMKRLPINSNIYSDAYFGKYRGKNVIVFSDGEDLFAYIKESYKSRNDEFLELVDETDKMSIYRDEEILTTWEISWKSKRFYRKSDPLYATQDIKFPSNLSRDEVINLLKEKASKYRKRILKAGGFTTTSTRLGKNFYSLADRKWTGDVYDGI